MENNLLGLNNNGPLTSGLAANKKAIEINVQDKNKADVRSKRDRSYKNIQDEANQSSEQSTKPMGSQLPKETAASGNKAAEKEANNADTSTTQASEQAESAASASGKGKAIAHKAPEKGAEDDHEEIHEEIQEDLSVMLLGNNELHAEAIVKPVTVDDGSNQSENSKLPLSTTDLELIKTRVDERLLKTASASIKEHITSSASPNLNDSLKVSSEVSALTVQDEVVFTKIDIASQDELKINEAKVKQEVDEGDLEAEIAVHKKLIKEITTNEPIDERNMLKPTTTAADNSIRFESTTVKEKTASTEIISNSQSYDTKSVSSVHGSKLTYKPESKPENPLSDKIFLMISKNENSAKLMVDPPELGPLEIKISQHEGTTHILFNTLTIAAKDAIEAQLNDLRDIFGQEGLNLGDVDVFHQNEQSDNEQNFSSNKSFSSANESNNTETISLVRNIRGLVDLYA